MASDHPKKINVGAGILKPGARPVKVYVDKEGEYWICDRDAEISGFDFAGAGCTPHSDVHLVK